MSVADEFIDKLVMETKKLNVGDPFNPKTDVGPLIDEDAALKLKVG